MAGAAILSFAAPVPAQRIMAEDVPLDARVPAGFRNAAARDGSHIATRLKDGPEAELTALDWTERG